MSDAAKIRFSIRSFRPEDAATCQSLYRSGLIGGTIADNDTGLDIDDIQMAYIQTPGNHFWVADSDEKVIGMIGVMHSDGTAEIRRLRVDEHCRRQGIGSALLEAAVAFCEENNYLRLALDTFVRREPAIQLFKKFHFRHDKTRNYAGKELIYFYLDLYSGEQQDGDS